MQHSATQDTATLLQEGFLILPELLSSSEVSSMREALRPFLHSDGQGRNNFEGYKTERIYSLVGRHPVFEALVEHPRVLALCDALLLPNYLLTASQAINIHPGETPQPFHTDDAFYTIPRPRPAISISTIVAIDPFTKENGATQIVVGSHTWGDEIITPLFEQIDFKTNRSGTPTPAPALPEVLQGRVVDVTMPSGSLIVFLGTLLHRGGENRSASSRLALSNQYCQPWARPQENYLLSIPREQARQMSARVRSLLGYSVHPPFMGHINGVHPLRLLDV